jgi:hypothetical protein
MNDDERQHSCMGLGDNGELERYVGQLSRHDQENLRAHAGRAVE